MPNLKNVELFDLIPLDQESSKIVERNPRFAVRSMSKYSPRRLCVMAGHESKFPGNIACFGRSPESNDIILDDSDYSRRQCQFYFTTDGELMLEDASSGRSTTLRVYNGLDEKGKAVWHPKYCLQGKPARGVIPRNISSKIEIQMGSKALFLFQWRLDTAKHSLDIWGDEFARWARYLGQKNRGLHLAVPLDRHVLMYEPRTENSPNIPSKYGGGWCKETHIYKRLGAGSFGVVTKSVDLDNGTILAVKHCKKPRNADNDPTENWKKEFKQEVEKLAQLQHTNIVRLIHHQGWGPGTEVQIFLKLYKGSAMSLIPRYHKCEGRFPVMEVDWLERLMRQMLSALEYLHTQSVPIIHRDVKPDNILYDVKDGKKYFFLSDFGFTASLSSIYGIAGTSFYYSPEITRSRQTITASDMYAFGVTLLELTGRICWKEWDMSVDRWRAKLSQNGVKHAERYRDRWENLQDYYPKARRSHSRADSLVQNSLLPLDKRIFRVMSSLLQEDFRKRPTATQALFMLQS